MAELKAGRYELLEELGRGAVGVVYKGFDPMIGRTVAVKTMRLTEEGTGLRGPDLVMRFQNETRAAGLLTHPNIVVVYDAGEESGLFYITMEYVEGHSLQALLDKKQIFPLPRIMKLMEQCCAALGYAHQHKVVHRDVKPANIMLNAEDTVKVTDFGTAKILQLGATQTGQIVGTPSYMSPEQVKGKSVDGRSDIFSLGVILYELVTGEKPFPGQNVTTVIYKIVHEDPIPPRELDSSVHPGLNQVIAKSLTKDPDNRYQNCRDFMEELRNYREVGGGRDLAGTVVMIGRGSPSPPAATPSPPPPSKPPEPPTPTWSGASVAIPTSPLRTTPAPSAPTSAARPTAPAPTPAPSGTERIPHPLYEESAPEPPKKRGSVWLALVLLALLAGGGYLVWPNVQQLLGTAPGVITGPTVPTPTESAPPGKKPPAPAGAEEKPAAPAASKTTETRKPASGEAAEPARPAKADPASVQARIEQRLARAGYGDKVRVQVSGNTVTLTGSVTRSERRRLLQEYRDLPAGYRLVDRIELARAAPGGEEEKPRTAPGKGEIEVVTDILGAQAVLKGPQGTVGECRTPCRFEDLSPGRYTMDISREGYRPVKRILPVRAGVILEERINFQPLASGIYVTSRPGKAEVLINGERQAELTPTTIRLGPGNYRIVVRKVGFEQYEGTVQLKPDELSQLNVELTERRKGVGWLDVRTVPIGADILIDGTNSGRRTPFRLELPAGQYTLTLYLKGYQAVRKRVVVEENRTAQVNELLPRP